MTNHISQVPRKVKKKTFFFSGGGGTVLYKGKEIDLTRSCIKQCERIQILQVKEKNVILRANIWILYKAGAILYKK